MMALVLLSYCWQWEYVGHGAGLGEEDDKHFDSMAERCSFNFSLIYPLPAT